MEYFLHIFRLYAKADFSNKIESLLKYGGCEDFLAFRLFA